MFLTRGAEVTRSTVLATAARCALIFAVAVAVFMPFLVDRLVTPQAVIVAALLGLTLAEGIARRSHAAPFVALAVYLGVAVVGIDLWFEADRQSAASLVFLLVPVALVAARMVATSSMLSLYLKVWVAVAAVNALVGIFERLTATTVFGQERYLVHSGMGKAIVAADHPLVLGVLLAGTVLLARPAIGRLVWVVGPILAGGALATNAIGPTAIAALALIVALFPSIGRFLQRRTWILGTVVVLICAVLVYLLLFVWNKSVPTMDLDEYSNQYRTAMYSFVPEILRDAPLGYGPGGPEAGTYTFDTALKGERDLAVQVDSEAMLLVLDFGWFGVAAFVAAFIVGIRGVSRNPAFGLAALAVTGAGFFVSIHAWGSSATFWVLLIGLAAWAPPVVEVARMKRFRSTAVTLDADRSRPSEGQST